MRPVRWACSKLPWARGRGVGNWLAGIALLVSLGALAGSVELTHIVKPATVGMQMSAVGDPSALTSQWMGVSPPDGRTGVHAGIQGSIAWYRVEFELPARPPSSGSWALYLPYLYDGGRFWLNGAPLASIAQTTQQTHVNWERPHLITMPDGQLRVGRNELLLRAVSTDPGAGPGLRRMSIGPREELLPLYERRMFWVHTMPQNAVVTCLVVGLFVGFVWWRNRGEVLYGLFGLVAVLWSIRTLNFVVEVMPAPWWPWWRVLYHASTGGFIVALALFAMRFAGLQRRWVERALFGYWLIGPLAMLASAGQLDSWVDFGWTGGMIPIGLAVIGFIGWAAWRQRSGAAFALLVAVALGTFAGIHDYAIGWNGQVKLPQVITDWLAHRIFLLHNAADLVLLVMVGILTLRFVQALNAAADLNLHLEDRVAERESELQARHAQVARLEREQAVAQERRRIMQDLHDGLGSQMFTALLRVERGAVDADELAQVLRDCIADMRLTFEVTAPEEADFRTTLGNFRFRWDGLLHDAGLATEWNVDGLPDTIALASTTALQFLRVAQEALTNVLKHAQASRVRVTLRADSARLELCVEDDGRGFAANEPVPERARGLSSMRHRAHQIGATLDVDSQPRCTRVLLRLPWPVMREAPMAGSRTRGVET